MYKTKAHLGKFLCTTILALIPSMHTLAQAEGKVIDEHGEPIVGATVRWGGTSVGTTTDANGKFRLEKNGHRMVLRFESSGLEALPFVLPDDPPHEYDAPNPGTCRVGFTVTVPAGAEAVLMASLVPVH